LHVVCLPPPPPPTMLHVLSFPALRLVGVRACPSFPVRSFHDDLPGTLWGHLEAAPLDGNHATNHAFEQDTSPLKVNLGRGVYKDDKGKNFLLPSVMKAEQAMAHTLTSHDYLPFSGLKQFTKATAAFAFGKDSPLIKGSRVATVQTISGTGALRVGAEFLYRFLPRSHARRVLVPNPTYVNHYPIFLLNKFEVEHYRYFDNATLGLDFDGMMDDLKVAPDNTVILLHACAHNPTGVDPNMKQWRKIAEVCKAKGHIAFFDSAYQGYCSGDPEADASAFRYFAAQGVGCLVAQSYAKNFGLYGQRVGALNIVSANERETGVLMSQLNQVIRPMYSNPPTYGARIVATIMDDPELLEMWKGDVKMMADRIKAMRAALVDALEAAGSKRDWSHITKQNGMFAYSGLSEKEVLRLRDTHVYMNLDGRMSISGINSGNVEYLAQAMHKATSA